MLFGERGMIIMLLVIWKLGMEKVYFCNLLGEIVLVVGVLRFLWFRRKKEILSRKMIELEILSLLLDLFFRCSIVCIGEFFII